MFLYINSRTILWIIIKMVINNIFKKLKSVYVHIRFSCIYKAHWSIVFLACSASVVSFAAEPVYSTLCLCAYINVCWPIACMLYVYHQIWQLHFRITLSHFDGSVINGVLICSNCAKITKFWHIWLGVPERQASILRKNLGPCSEKEQSTTFVL